MTNGSLLTVENPCDPNPCQNNGSCVPNSGAVECECSDQFQGVRCEEMIPDASELCVCSVSVKFILFNRVFLITKTSLDFKVQYVILKLKK